MDTCTVGRVASQCIHIYIYAWKCQGHVQNQQKHRLISTFKYHFCRNHWKLSLVDGRATHWEGIPSKCENGLFPSKSSHTSQKYLATKLTHSKRNMSIYTLLFPSTFFYLHLFRMLYVLPALLCGAFNIQALNFIIARHLPIQICKDTKTERKKKNTTRFPTYLLDGEKKKRPPIDFFCRKGNPNTDETAGLDLLLWPIHPDRWGVGNGSLPMRFGGEKTNKDFQELGPWFFL